MRSMPTLPFPRKKRLVLSASGCEQPIQPGGSGLEYEQDGRLYMQDRGGEAIEGIIMVFFPSYQYMEAVARTGGAAWGQEQQGAQEQRGAQEQQEEQGRPGRLLWRIQSYHMTEAEGGSVPGKL